jgi:hypothetical protein
MDNKALARELLEGVKALIRKPLSEMLDRVKALEARTPERGEKGDPGAAGERGADGAPGADGVAGKDGRDGIDGKDGAPGKEGERGEKGDSGEKGEKGDPGEPGPAGKDGEPGPAGKDGGPGPAGEKGIDGIDGRDGRDGEPGRDAVQVEVLAGIDSAKRYQRGTFAAYRGGIVRSFKATDPLTDGADLERCGWHVVVRGIADVDLQMDDDLRTVRLGMTMTDGQTVTKELTTGAVVYRGIWRAGAFKRGDAVTREGSTWIANADTDQTPGDGETAWQLAVKKGRDGRDGIRGEKGERGAEGKSGRDLTQLGFDGRRT